MPEAPVGRTTIVPKHPAALMAAFASAIEDPAKTVNVQVSGSLRVVDVVLLVLVEVVLDGEVITVVPVVVVLLVVVVILEVVVRSLDVVDCAVVEV